MLDAPPSTQPSPELHAPGRPGHRRRTRWRLWLGVSLGFLLVLSGVGVIALEPLRHALPLPTAAQTLPTSYRIPGAAPVLPWPAVGQAVVDIDGLGTMGGSGGETAVPIASVTKVMTAYVVLKSHPLAAGESGPTLRVSAEQAAAYPVESARGESLIRVTAGAGFTERQALQALMLASANNMARILAAWDAGSVTAFVTKMNSTAATLGMRNTRYTDPSGLDAGTVSTAADQVILTRAAMALPAFAEIVAMPRATVPVAGTITNYNALLGQDGVVGVKTGSTDSAGGCLVFAARITVGTTELTVVGAVFGQPGAATPQQLTAVFAATRLLIRAAKAALVVETVIRAGQSVAAVRGPLDTGTTLSAVADVSVIGWPGMDVRLAAELPPMPARLTAGAEHGRLTATAGGAAPAGTALRADGALEPPDTWTRIKRHK